MFCYNAGIPKSTQLSGGNHEICTYDSILASGRHDDVFSCRLHRIRHRCIRLRFQRRPDGRGPQGRWVERQADGISSGLVLGAAPAALADGSLVLYARDESTDMPVTVRLNSTDNGASWQSETLDWAEKQAHWHAGLPARTAPWRLQPPTPPCGSYNRTATRFSWTWAWTGEFLSQPDGVPARWHPGGCPVRRTGCFSAGKYSVL